MTNVRTRTRGAVLLTLSAGLFAVASVLLAGGASAQTVDCPAGARGGAGGRGGTSTGTQGGLALNVPLLSSGTGGATATGGSGGSARGGSGGRGGSGTLPVCNQNTNGAVAAPRATTYSAGGGGGGGGAYRGGGLAHTGSRTTLEIGLAGLAFVLGGTMLFVAQPRRIGA